MHIPLLRRALASTVLLAAIVATTAPTDALADSSNTAEAATTATVDVDVRAGLAIVPDTAMGVNHAIWDAELGTTAVSDLLKDAGVRMLRYPGGSYADIYHWKDHTAPGGYVAPHTDFDTFMAGAQRTGAQPMIIANYGTGTAQEAADWVRYANLTKGYGAKYWTIGNENYGNGHYGSAWEADDHADKSPKEYAATVVAYAEAMKAVDPDIKIGAVLTTPGNWPDGIVAEGDQGTWNQEVLSRAGGVIDFVDVHWYPGGATAAEALAKPEQIQDAAYLLRQQINRYAGSNAGRIGISLTETNVGVGMNTKPGALFLADVYAGLLEQGVFTVQWWNVHNGIGTVSTVAGDTDYGDFGLLSSGGCTSDGSVCEPAMNTPFQPYHALKVVGQFAKPGDQLVRAGSNDPLIGAHASRKANGDVALLLLNKDPGHSRTITVNFQGAAQEHVLPAYGISLVTLHPAVTGPPALNAPGRPTATAVTDRTATISWTPAPTGSRPVSKYEVYRQTNGASEQAGETGGTSFTMRNLEPGRRYTVNVVARDASGGQSASSLPVTFTTTSPATAGCTVRLTTSGDWGSGYVASVDITNTGASAVNGWTLAFGWPTGWQSLGSGWSATWEQTGSTVRATSDGTLPARGGTTTVGFVGNYSGPNVLPAVFTLNGSTCTTL